MLLPIKTGGRELGSPFFDLGVASVPPHHVATKSELGLFLR